MNIDQLIDPKAPPIPRKYKHGDVIRYINHERANSSDVPNGVALSERERHERKKETERKSHQRRVERERQRKTQELIASGYMLSSEDECYATLLDAIAKLGGKPEFAAHHGMKLHGLRNTRSKSDRPSLKICDVLGFRFITRRELKCSVGTKSQAHREYWRKA